VTKLDLPQKPTFYKDVYDYFTTRLRTILKRIQLPRLARFVGGEDAMIVDRDYKAERERHYQDLLFEAFEMAEEQITDAFLSDLNAWNLIRARKHADRLQYVDAIEEWAQSVANTVYKPPANTNLTPRQSLALENWLTAQRELKSVLYWMPRDKTAMANTTAEAMLAHIEKFEKAVAAFERAAKEVVRSQGIGLKRVGRAR